MGEGSVVLLFVEGWGESGIVKSMVTRLSRAGDGDGIWRCGREVVVE